MIEVNLQPGGKKRGPRGPKLSFKVPSTENLPTDPWVLVSSVVAIAVVGLAGYLYFSANRIHEELGVQIEEARRDSTRYADLIRQNDALVARRDSIAQRVSIIQEIDGDRFVWPHILDEVGRAVPEYTWLTAILETSLGDEIQFRISGRAGNNFALTRFMENLEASLFIRNVEFISTEQTITGAGGVERVVYDFMLDAIYERPPIELLETVPLFDAPPAGQ